mmetsp:Transcript_103109/g.315437  ORF Transcript_103109/g.315437 Transcript_103109/m.315437 type:complete len:236 (-) Transcript_103109:1164-1871(-)
MGLGAAPTLAKIASAAAGMKGAKKWAKMYTASSKSRMAAVRMGCFSGSFIFHGSKCAIHWLVARQAFKARSAAADNLYSWNAVAVDAFKSAMLNGSETTPWPHSGTFPPQSVTARLTRFPKLSHKSALCINFMESSLNFKSSPYAASRHKYHRTVSQGNLSSKSWGSTTLPRDFDIFRPSDPAIMPWTTTLRGSATPALLSMAGQMTEWNQEMSLPMMCIWQGQNLLKGCDGSLA